MAQSSYFPLRWESTGDQWWYASPIDWAAANGHYDVVRELLHLDANLLIKLTSLRRIRRLETVWDDDSRFADAAKCRSLIAKNLLLECETKNGKRNTLIRAGYGGWLLYTAASAGDMGFVQELIERNQLLVFGEGEFGVTDIFYAAARSKNSDVFRVLIQSSLSPGKGLFSSGGGRGEIEEEGAVGGDLAVFRSEIVNRAVHAAARGGNVGMLIELLGGCLDVLAYRDAHGSTVLHAAAGRGQVEVVKELVTSFNIIHSRDNQGNTSLHVAAFRGHLSVVDALLRASSSSASLTNNAGDTFLHMAVAGFRSPGFRRLDRQMELMKQLVCGSIINIQSIVNMRNSDGKTVLHLAVIGTVHPDLVELLMTIPSINLNIRDVDGMTPLDLLSQRSRTGSSEILIKQLISAGGIPNLNNHIPRLPITSQLKMYGNANSPGASFCIPDAEILLYTGIVASEDSRRSSSCSSACKSDIMHCGMSNDNHESSSSDKKQNSVNKAVKRLKVLVGWPRHKEKKNSTPKKLPEDDSIESLKKWTDREDTPTPLRQRFSRQTSLVNNKRTLSVRNSIPSPATKKKFTAGLMHGVIQAMPHLAPPVLPPPSSVSKSSMSSPTSDKQKTVYSEVDNGTASCSNSSMNGGKVENIPPKLGFANKRLMNQYFCFGAQGLRVGDSIRGRRSTQTFKGSAVSVA